MKAKVFQVSIDGQTHLVEAQTKAGAVRDVVAAIADRMKAKAIADLATGEQIYQAGLTGEPIIGSARFARAVDPSQMPLLGVPETAAG